jgi:hypothetical protein|tara:strand:+ start:824 stop:1051 length:228 start_codon:yes stop_codon:yes gene_type:complete
MEGVGVFDGLAVAAGVLLTEGVFVGVILLVGVNEGVLVGVTDGLGNIKGCSPNGRKTTPASVKPVPVTVNSLVAL